MTKADIPHNLTGHMPPDRQVQTLALGPWSAAQIRVQPQPADIWPSAAQTLITQHWQAQMTAAQAHGRHLFNGPVWNLCTWELSPAGTLELRMEPSDFATFVARGGAIGAQLHQYRTPWPLGPLGNSALIWQDGHFIAGVRSQRTLHYADHLHVFGGILDAVDTSEAHPLLAHLYRELEEELGLRPEDYLAEPTALALFYEPKLAQPEIIWLVKAHNRAPLQPAGIDAHEHGTCQRWPIDHPLPGDHTATPLLPLVTELARKLLAD